MTDFTIFNLFNINNIKEKEKQQNATSKIFNKLPIDFEEICDINRPILGRYIDIVLYRAVLLSLVKYLGFNALSKLYHAGVDFGKRLGVKSIDEMIECFESLRIGIPELVSEDPIKIRVYECAFCSGLPNIGKPVCHFERGVLTGCLEDILNKKVKIVESKCCANGHDYCEFKEVSK
ncbi:MAG TPA: hypothetical protein EYG77_02475 [Methanothermococcus okinawensis]|nr:hypothetical protein [Methanothermococcus okinawensis]